MLLNDRIIHVHVVALMPGEASGPGEDVGVDAKAPEKAVQEFRFAFSVESNNLGIANVFPRTLKEEALQSSCVI